MDLEDLKILLEEMAFNEEKIMELYWIYEHKLPVYAQVWKKLAEEEKGHANILKSFAMLSDGREIEADLKGITMEAVKNSIKFLNREIEKTKTTKLTGADAFETAVKIESSLLEKSIFSSFDTKDKDLKKIINVLETDTRRHYEKVKELADSFK